MAKKTSKDAAKSAKTILSALDGLKSTSKEDMFSDFFGMSEEDKKNFRDEIDTNAAIKEITENKEGYDIVDIERLVPNPLSKFHMRQDESWSAIRDMMQRHGFVKGFLITGVAQPDGKIRIISGHRRCAIAKSVGIKKVPVMLVEINSEAEEIDLVLAANHNRGESVTDILKNYLLCGERYDLGLWSEEERSGFKTKRAFIANKLGYPESKIINHEFLLHYDPKLWILIDEKVFTVNDIRKVYNKTKDARVRNSMQVMEKIVKDKTLFDQSIPLSERRAKGKEYLSELEIRGNSSTAKKKQIRSLIKPISTAVKTNSYSIPVKAEDRKRAVKDIEELIHALKKIEAELKDA